MKKFLLVLGMVTCIFGMTACGSEDAKAAVSQEELESFYETLGLEQFVHSLDQVLENNLQDQVADNQVYVLGLTAWESAKEEIGTLNGVTGHELSSDGSTVTVNIDVDGELHDAVVVMDIDMTTYELASITVNVTKSMGELMTNAALNTLIGMGTVFIVLILIAWLISLFKYISVFEKKMADRKAKKNAVQAPAAAPSAALAETAAEETAEETAEEDDCELVAVIAAAIAASEGAASTDGFVVRSIKRRTGKWQKA